jgi:hypothetical protein
VSYNLNETFHIQHQDIGYGIKLNPVPKATKVSDSHNPSGFKYVDI